MFERTSTQREDYVAIEAPLEIRLKGSHGQKAVQFGILMRSPGNDIELIYGLLFNEGIISDTDQIEKIHLVDRNVVEVFLIDVIEINQIIQKRISLIGSSCGFCGKESLEALDLTSNKLSWFNRNQITSGVLSSLPGKLRLAQKSFDQSGSIHAAAVFSYDGKLMNIQEDIGRHNALDKLIGHELVKGREEGVIVLSGRNSFEMTQKVAMAGYPIIASIGAPSSMAIELAENEGITLVGFLREQSFNIYSCPDRIVFD